MDDMILKNYIFAMEKMAELMEDMYLRNINWVNKIDPNAKIEIPEPVVLDKNDPEYRQNLYAHIHALKKRHTEFRPIFLKALGRDNVSPITLIQIMQETDEHNQNLDHLNKRTSMLLKEIMKNREDE
jgi:hypothetical protein